MHKAGQSDRANALLLVLMMRTAFFLPSVCFFAINIDDLHFSYNRLLTKTNMALHSMHQNIPKRYLLSLLAFFGFLNAFILRSNLSIAIVSMVKSKAHIPSNNISITESVKVFFF
jgi:hypothetical protein